MSKIIFEPSGENIKITTIWRGIRRSRHNTEEMLTTKNYANQVKKFLKKPSLESLGELMNCPNSVHFDASNRESCFKEEIHQAYFFIMHLLWALEEKLEVIEKGGGAR